MATLNPHPVIREVTGCNNHASFFIPFDLANPP
jgi:hypothetical protein